MASIDTNTVEYFLTREEINFLRIANLILRVVPTAIRVKFDEEFNPGGLQTELNKARFKVLEPLKSKKTINQAQWDFMFPVTGKYQVKI